ncbi:leucine-rich repeat protein [Clostridium neonatale]|uniref:leucine-rich repeat domain-containing protein n=1 Tax=Clostridium neonatale TaxID=137838 RepID=UPI003D334679
MKKRKSTKIISSLLVVFSVLALTPVSANAEWKKDNVGWWYSAVDLGYQCFYGWNKIDGKWYYFALNKDSGRYYMVTNTIVDGYTIGADGVWNESIPRTDIKPFELNGSDFDFNAETGTLVKYNGKLEGYNNHIIIPSEINGIKVKEIGSSCFYQNDNIIEVIIPEGIETIADGVFVECANLRTVSIPNTVKTIRFGAFCMNENLTNVVVPNSVTDLAEYVFDGCPKMGTLTIPKTLNISDEKLVGGYFTKTTKIIRV